MSFDKTLTDLTQGLRRRDIRSGAPRGLEAKITSALPADPMPSTAHFPVFAFVGSVTAITALAVGFGALALHLKGKQGNPGSPLNAECIRIVDAVSQQNTWHFIEYDNTVNGASHTGPRKIAEYWGRRSPYFYRAEAHGITTIDDGKTLVEVVPSGIYKPGVVGYVPADSRSGLVNIFPSPARQNRRYYEVPPILLGDSDRSGQDKRGHQPADVLGGISSESDRIVRDMTSASDTGSTGPRDTTTLERASATNVIPRDNREFVTRLQVATATHLPLHYKSGEYRVKPDSLAVDDTVAPELFLDFSAEYNCALPPTITNYFVRTGYTVNDYRNVVQQSGSDEVFQSNGDHMQAKPDIISRDAGGNLLVRISPILDGHICPARLDNFKAKDDLGNTYLCAIWSQKGLEPTKIIVAPADPEKVAASAPRRLAIECDAYVSTDTPSFETSVDAPEFHATIRGLLSTALKGVPNSLDLSSASRPTSEHSFSLLQSLAVARARYFSAGRSSIPTVSSTVSVTDRVVIRKDLDARDVTKAAYWWMVAADEAQRSGMAGSARQYRSYSKSLTSH